MNYAIFGQWVTDRVEELVSFGVPRDEAAALLETLSCGAINAEARQRSEHQFLLDFKRVGVAGMSERLGITTQAVWKRRRKLLSKPAPSLLVDSTVD